MTTVREELTCPNCRMVACECGDAESTHGRFKTGHVDPDSWKGFDPTYWAGAILNHGPVRVDPVSDAMWSYRNGVWVEHRTVVHDRLPLMMGRNYKKQNVGTAYDYLRARLLRDGLTVNPSIPETRYVSVPSGLFELASGEMMSHDPDVLTTYQLQVEPTFYAPTPEFDRFLDAVLHPGDRDRVLDILAYLLTPGNPAQKAVMLSGSGRNGKGVLMRLVEAILGSQNIASVSLQEMSTRFAAADLYGVPLNMVGDIDGEHITHTGRFKQITGDDLVRMDVKNAHAFKAKVWAVPVFSANTIPTSADTSFGYLRRWEVVEFPNTFDGSDLELEDRLMEELSAITGRLLMHAVGSLNTIRETDAGRRAHDVFAKRSDPVRQWLAECAPFGFVTRPDAYREYKDWVDDGNGRTPLLKSNFFARVSQVLGAPVKRNGNYGWDFGQL